MITSKNRRLALGIKLRQLGGPTSSGHSQALTLLFVLCLCTCGRAQSLDSLKVELRANNPELRALQLDYEAALQIGAQREQLPDLELGAGFFLLPVQTRTGPQQFRVGATQMLPWPGKLTAMAAVADAQAKPLLEKVAVRQLDLIFQLEQAYFQLAGLQGQGQVLTASLDLYESLNQLALRRIETSAGSSVDVYRIQLQTQQTERKLAELRFRSQQKMVVINRLLDRPADTQITAQADLTDRVDETLEFAPDLAADDPDFSQHPALRLFGLQRSVHESAIALSEFDQRPDFGIGLDYIATGKRNDADPPGNGRDVFLPRAMIRLPLSKGKFTAKRQEETIRIKALSARREATEAAFRAALRSALLTIDNAANELLFLQEQSRVIEATIAIARSEFANGQRAFDELLRLENQLIDYRSRSVMAQTTIVLQRAEIDRYLLNN